MTDLQTAKNNLSGHTICLCKDGKTLFSDLKGISPMMAFILDGRDLSGYSVADLVVGKAAAMLFVKCSIKNVFAKTLSAAGKRFLQQHGVYCEYEILTDRIINRTGTDVCPMEKAVSDTEDCEEGYLLLKNQLEILRSQK